MPFALPPDKYHRYFQATRLGSQILSSEESALLLDIGAHEGILKQFLPRHRIIEIDLQTGSGKRGFLAADACHLPFRPHSFDIGFALDVLEHIPPHHRLLLMKNAALVCRSGLILSFPTNHPEIARAEAIFQELHTAIHGQRDLYLNEHAENPPVSADDIRCFLESHYLNVSIFPDIYYPFWVFVTFIRYLLAMLPGNEPLEKMLNVFYNNYLISSAIKHPSYRLIVCASNSPVVPTPWMNIEQDTPQTISHLTELKNALESIFCELSSHTQYSQKLQKEYSLLQKQIESHFDEIGKITLQYDQTLREMYKKDQYIISLELQKQKLQLDLAESERHQNHLQRQWSELHHSYHVMKDNNTMLQRRLHDLEKLLTDTFDNTERPERENR